MHPVHDELSEPYWLAAKSHKLLIQRCPVTLRYQWYPRAHSIYAPHASPQWVEASGLGKIFTFSVIFRGHGPRRPPYICALVELEEDVLFTTQLREIKAEDVVVGLPVQVAFEYVDGDLTLPYFVPRGQI